MSRIKGLMLCLPLIKGWAGESLVRGVLMSLPRDNYIVLNDLYFRGSDWSCQIDHLVLSRFGLFCIETKNYLGIIEGSYHEKYLLRIVLGKRYKTYSPIYQNYRHLQRLVETFPVIKAHSRVLHSVICFMPGLKPRIKGSGAASICIVQHLKKEIMKYKKPKLSLEECEEIRDQILKSLRNKH